MQSLEEVVSSQRSSEESAESISCEFCGAEFASLEISTTRKERGKISVPRSARRELRGKGLPRDSHYRARRGFRKHSAIRARFTSTKPNENQLLRSALARNLI